MGKVPNWYVITGGPNSGKTTILDYLSRLGYYTIPEYARLLIEKEMEKGKKLEEIRNDEIKFQNKVLNGKLQLEKKAPKNKIVFLDRGIPDSIAYYRFLKGKFSKEVWEKCKNRYRKIFLLDMLPYKNDYARNESKKDAQKIHRLIKQTYEELGYKVIRIPIMSVEDRVKMILKHVSSV